MKFDQTSRDLLAAARYIERRPSQFRDDVPLYHLLSPVAHSLGAKDVRHPKFKRYEMCAARLFEIVGYDLSDFTRSSAIDILVAAAYWDVPQAERKDDEHRLTAADAKHQKPVPLVQELRVEACLVPNRRGFLYCLAADRIEALERVLRQSLSAWENEEDSVKDEHRALIASLRKALA